jgi:spore coat protein A, manganese oxidase
VPLPVPPVLRPVRSDHTGDHYELTQQAAQVEILLAPFQVLSIGGNDPGPYNHGWKDTVNLDNGDDAELLVHFDSFRGRYVFHCRNLEHEDMMMMGNFQVT